MHHKNLNIYSCLSTEVYDLSKPTPPEDSYRFYRSYIKNANGPVLEPMCGTGRFLLPLTEEGFNICGFDASSYMLQTLSMKAKRKGLTPNIWKEFVEDFVSQEHYDLIFIPSGSFSLIVNQDTICSVINTFYKHLTKGGILLFEAHTYKSIPQLNILRGSRWIRSDGKMIMLGQYAVLEKNICSFIRKYELVDNSKVINTEVEELRFRLYEPLELVTLLKNSGFSSVTPIKPFDKYKKPNAQDKTIVYECRK